MGSDKDERPPEHKRAPGLEAQDRPAHRRSLNEVLEAGRKYARLLGLGRELTDEEVRKVFKDEAKCYEALKRADLFGRSLNAPGNTAYWRERFRTDSNLRNDWGFWALYLEQGRPVFGELRPVLVKALRGESRPSQRIKSVETTWRHVRIALLVSEKRRAGCRRDKAVEEAAKEFCVSKRIAQAAAARYLFTADSLRDPKDFLRRVSEFFDYGALARARDEKK
jgi:hypothetical protein